MTQLCAVIRYSDRNVTTRHGDSDHIISSELLKPVSLATKPAAVTRWILSLERQNSRVSLIHSVHNIWKIERTVIILSTFK